MASLRELRVLIAEYFNQEDLRILAFDLSIDWDELSGTTKSKKISSLISFLIQRERFVNLLKLLEVERPSVNWQKFEIIDLDNFSRADKKQEVASRKSFMVEDFPTGFVPRAQLHEQIILNLISLDARKSPVAISSTLKGAGGYGKTTLAIAICHDNRIQHTFPDGVFWITLGEQGEVLSGIRKVYAELTEERPNFIDIADAANALAQSWGNKRCLFVIDDVWNPLHLKPFLRGGKNCVRLITTRNMDVTPLNSLHTDVDAMEINEAVQLLSHRLQIDENNTVSFLALANRLGNWPILLKLINRFLVYRIPRQSLPDALIYVNQALDQRGLTAFDAQNPLSRSQAISKTIDVSISLLSDKNQTRYRELAIFPEDVDIPLNALNTLWGASSGLSKFETEELCEHFYRLSLLLDFNPTKKTIRLHDVIRQYLLSISKHDILEIHNNLLEGYRKKCSYDWDTGPNDDYFFQYLPFHLAESGKIDQLMELILKFNWLQAKLDATNANELIYDFNLIPDIGISPHFLQLKEALQESRHVINDDASQLAGQLQGRLLGSTESEIQTLLMHGRQWNRKVWLCPLVPNLYAPGGPLKYTLTRGHQDWVKSVSVTPNGKYVVSGSHDKQVVVWDLKSGQIHHILAGHIGYVKAVAATYDSQFVISASHDKTLKVWELETGNEKLTLSGHLDRVKSVAVSSDNKFAISSSNDNTIRVWNLQSGEEMKTLQGHTDWVWSVILTPDNRSIISASHDRTIKIWDCYSGELEKTLIGHKGKVWGLSITPNSKYIISASEDCTAKVWDLETGKEVFTLKGHTRWVRAVTTSLDSNYAITASADSTIKIWSLHNGEEVKTFEGHAWWVVDVKTIPESNLIVSASADRTLKVWDISAEINRNNVYRHMSEVTAIAVTRKSSIALTGSKDSDLLAWSLYDLQKKYSFNNHSSSIVDITIAPNDDFVLSISMDGIAHYWNIHNCELSNSFQLEKNPSSVSIISDGHRAIFGFEDGTIQLWKVPKWEILREWKGHLDRINAIVEGAQQNQIISVSNDYCMKIWDIEGDSEVYSFIGHTDRINDVILMPDRKRVITASWDTTIRIWNLETKKQENLLTGHNRSVTALAISKCSRFLISSSRDRSIRLWDLVTNKILATFHTEKPVNTCAFSLDENIIVAGDESGQIHFMRIKGLT